MWLRTMDFEFSASVAQSNNDDATAELSPHPAFVRD
jgi:hypothetical protein